MSKPLQHYTAEAINGALLEAQSLGIPAIPDVDAIICPQQYRDDVCRLIGQQVYNITGGVCCQVGGVRYTPVDVDGAAVTDSTQQECADTVTGGEQEAEMTTPWICLPTASRSFRSLMRPLRFAKIIKALVSLADERHEATK